MLDFRQAREIIEREIALLDIPDTPVDLYGPIRYMMGMGGKRLRPCIVLVTASLYSGNTDHAVYPALAMELFHNFTLVHDDIMDNSVLRRTKPTVHVRWNQNVAILSGDVMSILAFRLLIRTREEILPAVMDLFTRTAIHVCEGQRYDMDYENLPAVGVDEYIRMIRLKTSALIATCFQMGALIGGADKKDASCLFRFGENLGLAFQLRDDYLDVFGDPARFGKTPGGDIVANKKTYLLIKALETAKGNELKVLENSLKEPAPDPEEKVRKVKGIFEKLGIDAFVRQEMDRYYRQALDCLADLQLPESGKKVLLDFASDMMKREE